MVEFFHTFSRTVINFAVRLFNIIAMFKWLKKLIFREKQYEEKICPICRGSGVEYISKGYVQVPQTCSECSGSGAIMVLK